MPLPIPPGKLDQVRGALKTSGLKPSNNVTDCRGALCRETDGSINWGESWNQLGAERAFERQLENTEYPPLPPTPSNPHK